MSTGDANTVFSLPADWYHDTAVWRAERRAIFAREWLWVGCEAQLAEPGSYLTAEPAGFPLFVLRDEQGGFAGSTTSAGTAP